MIKIGDTVIIPYASRVGVVICKEKDIFTVDLGGKFGRYDESYIYKYGTPVIKFGTKIKIDGERYILSFIPKDKDTNAFLINLKTGRRYSDGISSISNIYIFPNELLNLIGNSNYEIEEETKLEGHSLEEKYNLMYGNFKIEEIK